MGVGGSCTTASPPGWKSGSYIVILLQQIQIETIQREEQNFSYISRWKLKPNKKGKLHVIVIWAPAHNQNKD
jgi:hypothetical protein